MKNLLENKWIRLILYIVFSTILAMIIFPLLDFVLSLFTKSAFVYSFNSHIRDPIIFGIVLGVIELLIHSRKDSK